MLKLSSLLSYDSVMIQCHDNPDADALGSALGLYRYFRAQGKEAQIVYGGFAPIQKSNLTLFTRLLDIPARYISGEEAPVWDGLLITVDCQYKAGNVKPIAAKQVAVIDHHMAETELPELSDVRPYLGSCSTLVWALLRQEGFDFGHCPDVAAALYYGLFTDTNSLAEISHPLDRDMRDSLRFDPALLKRLRNTNLSIGDLALAGEALIRHTLDEDTRSAVFQADPCDPNILGFTADLALQVDCIDVCVVFCQLPAGIKLSVRSCVREVMASELAASLCKGVGSGGGHKDKAGGFLSRDALSRLGLSPAAFLRQRLTEYFAAYDLLYCGRLGIDTAVLPRYVKKPLPLGFVPSTELFPPGTQMTVRTLEGDAVTVAGEDIYIMIGLRQEVYPIRREKFLASYRALEERYVPDPRFLPEGSYTPTVKGGPEMSAAPLFENARACVGTGGSFVYIKRLTRPTKLFTVWNPEGYMFGGPGDCLAIRSDDGEDAYIIDGRIFDLSYEEL